jgi:outer membrane protein
LILVKEVGWGPRKMIPGKDQKKEEIMTKTNLLLSTALVALGLPSIAQAGDGYDFWAKNRWEIRGRAISVLPDENSDLSIAGDATVSNALVPEVDITHYITPNIGVEVIAAIAPHTLQLNGSTDLGDTVILPPTITVQYHFAPDAAFNPYIGAGVNYSTFFNTDTATGFNDLKVSGGFGTALQAGFDYWLNDHWGVNIDAKKLWLNVDARVNGTVTADVDLNPWILGAGVAYHF